MGGALRPLRGLWVAGELALASRVSGQLWALGPGFTPLFCSPTVPMKGTQSSQRGAFSTSVSGKFYPRKGRGLRSYWMWLEPQRLGDPGCSLSLAPNQFQRRGTFQRSLPPGSSEPAQETIRPSPALVSLFLLLREARESGVNSPGVRPALP